MKKCGIYRFYNKINNKSYIGQSNNLRHRYTEHISLLRRGQDGCSLLQRAWDKYGEDNFAYEIICFCEESELDDLEKKYIRLYDSFDNGYNCNIGGCGNCGFNHSEEVKIAISASLSGIKRSESTKKKMSEWQKGKSLTAEHRQALSAAWTDERKKMASANWYINHPKGTFPSGGDSPNAVKVQCHTGEIFNSVREPANWCSQKTSGNISACLSGKRTVAGKHPITGEPLRWARI